MNARPGSRALLAFLDYDGVLHPSDVHFNGTECYFRSVVGHQLFEHAPLLEQMLEPYPDVQLVLSTRWVFLFGLERAAAFLTPSLRERVIGSTLDFATSPDWDHWARGKQVLSDVEAREPADWLALDDDAFGWPQQHRKRVVISNQHDGLADPATAQRLGRLLIDMDRGRRRRNRLAMRRMDLPSTGSAAPILKTVPYDGLGAVEVEVDHVVALGLKRARLRAYVSSGSEERRCELWNSRGQQFTSVLVQPPEAGISLLHWTATCLAQAVAEPGEHERRPTFGTTTVLVRVDGVKACEFVFGVSDNKVNQTFDISACRSLWSVIAEVLRSGAGHPAT